MGFWVGSLAGADVELPVNPVARACAAVAAARPAQLISG